jgi:3-phosphoglycerate kinase
MDFFEIKQASAGTFSVAEAIAKSGAMSIIGGEILVKR